MGSSQAKSRGPYTRRPASRKRRTSEGANSERETVVPRLHQEARNLLKHIGKPKPAPFKPDPFQKQALQAVSRADVVVSAPTGSGKTWIALEATRQSVARGERVWYATPLKALSNSKYEEFGDALGTERVGILTGDRKENPDAPVIVGTTEILRNQLYDSMHEGRDLEVHLVILDEFSPNLAFA